MRIQKPVKGGRQKLSLGAIRRIDREVSRAAVHFGVSKSFVICDALADYFGIEEQERIKEVKPQLRAIRGGRR